jgi:hypothetical protein
MYIYEKEKNCGIKQTAKKNLTVQCHQLGKKVLGHIGLQSYRCSVKVKVNCTLVQALRLCTGRTAHRGSRGIALLYRH